MIIIIAENKKVYMQCRELLFFMQAIIIQQAEILDPRTVPGYMNEVARYKQATNAKIHGWPLPSDPYPYSFDYQRAMPLKTDSDRLLIPEGPTPYDSPQGTFKDTVTLEEFNRITSGAAMGATLYSYAIEYLRPLNISSISRDRSTKNGRIPKGIWTLDGLRKI